MWKLKLSVTNLITLVFLVSSFIGFSQNRISGSILSDKNEKLAFANVTVYDEGGKNMITYAISDDKGQYNLSVPNGVYLFKVSYLGFKPVSLKKRITKTEIINFKLQEDKKTLDEVVIKAKALEANIQNDTIQYNLKQIKSGNEKTLKDIIKKLPGVEIDNDGKIKANGKKIDKLLIDGKAFFGDQHQLATENINSDMVKGISLLNNYKDMSDLDSPERSGKTAMNIEIGENYKGRFHGNMSVAGGSVKKYETKTNLFSFGQKTNLYFIGSANNLGKQTFTIEDYIGFMGIEKFVSDYAGSTELSDDDFLYYLVPDTHVKSKVEQSAAVNFSFNPSNQFKLNTYVILNRNNITKAQAGKQTYLTNLQNIVFDMANTSDNTLLINNSYINAVYKPSAKTVFDYAINFSPQNHQLRALDQLSLQNYDTHRQDKNYALNQELNYKQQIGPYRLKANLYHGIKNYNKALDISSNSDFLGLNFQGNNYTALQNVKQNKTDLGMHLALSRHIVKNLSVKATYKWSGSKENFQSEVYHNALYNKLKLNILEHMVGLYFYNKEKTLVNYNIGLRYSLLQINTKNMDNFLPAVYLKLNFKTAHFLNLSYNRTIKWPQAGNLVANSYITSFNTLANNQNIQPNSLIKSDDFDLTYHITDLFSGTDFTLNASFSLRHHIITTNILFYSDYSLNRFYLGNNDKSYNTYFNFTKKFSKIPFKLKLKSGFSYSEQNNFIEGQIQQVNTNSLSNNLKISSRLKHSFFDFEMGYKRTQRIIKDKSSRFKNMLILNKPYLNLIFDFKKLSLTIKNSLVSYQSSLFNREYLQIDPVLNYETKKWIFFIKGKDILNMNRNYIVENAFYDNYLEEKTVAVLGGYIITGFQYRF